MTSSAAAATDPKLTAFQNTPGLNVESDQKRFSTLFEPHHVVVAVAPNYVSQDNQLLAMPGAKNALTAAFGQEAIAADAAASSGFALKVDGSLALNSEERIAHIIGGYNAGLATSRYDVEEEPAHLLTDEQIAASHEDARDRLPQLISPHHRNSHERTQDANGNNKWSIFVTANDLAAAKTLRQTLKKKIADKQPVTVHQLVSMPEYKKLADASQCKRDNIAKQYAEAYNVKLSSARPHTTEHYSITPENVLAHGSHASLAPQSSAKTEEMYIVHNNTANTDLALQGVTISHGIIGGKTIVESSVPKKTPSASTVEWQQKDWLSHMPTDSGQFHTVHSQVAARHRNETDNNGKNDKSKEFFANRVVWTSDLGEAHLHPLADEKFNAINDPFSAKWLEKLNTPGDPPLRQTSYKVVTAQLPDVSTQHLDAAQLGALARQEGTPANIPVNVESELVGRITKNWTKIRDPYSKILAKEAKMTRRENKAKLENIFANAYDESHTNEMQALTSGAHALCSDKTHSHANTAPLSPPGTTINLDKRLIRLLTE